MRLDEVSMKKFPGGEVHVELGNFDGQRYIFASITNTEDIIKLLMVTDAFKRRYGFTPELYLPYIPYARQDRVANLGEALSIKVFADLINSQEYPKVHVLDPHSDVATALINNVQVTDCTVFAKKVWDILPDEDGKLILLAPDAGALKKVHKIAKSINYKDEVIFCEKQRDTVTGKITGTKVYSDDIAGNDFIMFDDICDGGRTFIEIAKVLKSNGARKVILAVSHGIFSNGLESIYEYIDEIYCTDSFKVNTEEMPEELKVEGKWFMQFNSLELMMDNEYCSKTLQRDLRRAV